MKMRFKRFFARAKMVRAFYKGRPVDPDSIQDPITRSFLKFFNCTPVRVPNKTIIGKELRRTQR